MIQDDSETFSKQSRNVHFLAGPVPSKKLDQNLGIIKFMAVLMGINVVALCVIAVTIYSRLTLPRSTAMSDVEFVVPDGSA